MNIFRDFEGRVRAALAAMESDGLLPPGLDTQRVAVEPPREADHGDMSTNAALVLAKTARVTPRVIAEHLAEIIAKEPGVSQVTIAGPGFINWRLANHVWYQIIKDALLAGTRYGDSKMGAATRVNVEYVSANPTGPLHAAHARGAVVGDALAMLLEKTGHKVTREYYINDAGAQVDVLARSTHIRYRQALGEEIGEIPAGLYPGDYLKEIGQDLAQRYGDRWLSVDEVIWLPQIRDFAVATIMDWIRKDLLDLGVRQDVFSSERELIASGLVDQSLDELSQRDLLYTGVLEPPRGRAPDDWEPRPQLLFRASRFGDDSDRAVRRSDGTLTYFASDIAYHHDKFRRGASVLIGVWGADHGGYIKRLQAATSAITNGGAKLDIKICQLVSLMQDGKPLRMSKRAGTFVTLSDVLAAVGRDVLRFIMLTRRNDQSLEFDLARVTEQSRENPVFYVQYAHARICSVQRHAATLLPVDQLTAEALARVPLDQLDTTDEIAILRCIAQWPRVVEAAAESHEPHRIAFFLQELAAAFHGLWTRGREDAALRFLIDGDMPLTLARLAMITAVAAVIRSGLEVIGVVPVEELRE